MIKMSRYEEMLYQINRDITENKIKKGDLAKRLGVTNTTLSFMINGKSGTSVSMKKLCAELDKMIEEKTENK